MGVMVLKERLWNESITSPSVSEFFVYRSFFQVPNVGEFYFLSMAQFSVCTEKLGVLYIVKMFIDGQLDTNIDPNF